MIYQLLRLPANLPLPPTCNGCPEDAEPPGWIERTSLPWTRHEAGAMELPVLPADCTRGSALRPQEKAGSADLEWCPKVPEHPEVART